MTGEWDMERRKSACYKSTLPLCLIIVDHEKVRKKFQKKDQIKTYMSNFIQKNNKKIQFWIITDLWWLPPTHITHLHLPHCHILFD